MPDGDAGIWVSVVATGADLVISRGVTGTIGLVVTGPAGTERKMRFRIVDGQPVEATGVGAGAEHDAPDPELTFTLPSAEAEAIAAGTLDPSVAFMRGRLKTAGDNALLLGVLAATADAGFTPWLVGLTSTLDRT